jgi:hypothetical protein
VNSWLTSDARLANRSCIMLSQVYQWMETELMPKFVHSPAYQTLATRAKSPTHTMSFLSLSGGAGSSEATDTVPPPDTEASTGLRKQRSGGQLASQGSADFDALLTARDAQSTFEDVLAGANPRVEHNFQLDGCTMITASHG